MTRPDFTGVWLADIRRSRFRTQVPRKLVLRITHNEPEIRHEILSVDYGGTERRADHRFVVGGEIETEIGEIPTTVAARWQGQELVIESRRAGGDARFADYWSLSSDGNTLTMEHRDDMLAGQICILERVPQSDAP